VKIHYTGKLEDGTVFDSSADSEPLQFTIGANQVIAGVEEAVIGMKPGESKSATVPAEKAYGSHSKEMVMKVDRKEISTRIPLEVGQHLRIPQPNDKFYLVRITEVSEEAVTFDGNHPLAGKDLTFDITLEEIV